MDKFFKFVLFCGLGLFVVIMVGHYTNGPIRKEYPPQSAMAQTPTVVPPPVKFPYAPYVIKLTDTKLTKSRYGLLTISGKLENIADSPAKDIEISCDVEAQSGTKLRTLRETVYVAIDQGKSHRFKDITLGIMPEQGEGLRCFVSKVLYEGKIVRS